jgi:hypothetical protein
MPDGGLFLCYGHTHFIDPDDLAVALVRNETERVYAHVGHDESAQYQGFVPVATGVMQDIGIRPQLRDAP